MDVNSLPKTITRQRRCCDLNPGPSAPESSTLTTRLFAYFRSVYIYRSRHLAVSVKCKQVATVLIAKGPSAAATYEITLTISTARRIFPLLEWVGRWPPKLPLSMRGSGSPRWNHPNTWFLEFTRVQTAPRSVHPFLHGARM